MASQSEILFFTLIEFSMTAPQASKASDHAKKSIRYVTSCIFDLVESGLMVALI